MAGHSKWATTKRHKAAVDTKRGKLFSIISKDLAMAAKSGGGDPEFNPRLRTFINKAKAANMPAENVYRAIKKGTGELPGVVIEEITYEGYGPAGVGIIVESTTDNKNRTTAEVRRAFTQAGGRLASSGAVSYSFKYKGQFLISTKNSDEDTLMEISLDAGAEDVVNNDDHFEILCPVSAFDKVFKALSEKEIPLESSELAYLPISSISLKDAEVAKQILKLINKLDDLEDTKNIFANFKIDDKIIKASSP